MSDADARFAQVEILPAAQADKILSAPSIGRVRTIYGVVFPLTVMAGAGLLTWAAIVHRYGVDEQDPAPGTLAVVLCFLGISLLAVVLAIRLRVGTRNHWLRRVARQEINRRPDKIVNPDAPGVRFVEVVPRSAWSDTTLVENASDVGFVDLQPGWLLFEGDNERYRIPAGAIVKCEQDYYTRLLPSKSTNILFHFVIVTVKISEQMSVEVPFRIRGTISLRSDRRAAEANYEFLRAINHLKAAARDAHLDLP